MSAEHVWQEVASLEREIFELTGRLNALRKQSPGKPVSDYGFDTIDGRTSMRALFGDKDRLLLIHNMGQGCRYCTLWADGFNGFLPHLESVMSVVLVSKDPPDVQRAFANSRGWRFRLASHGGGDYIREQTVIEGERNVPGAVAYGRLGDSVVRLNACMFGPGDLYCSIWPLLALGGIDSQTFTPQYRYWQRPGRLDDGGNNVVD